MKRYSRYLLLIVVFPLLISSCSKTGDEGEVMIVPSDEAVYNLSAESTSDGVVLKWKLREDVPYDKIDIWYMEEEQKETLSKDVSGSEYSLDISLSTDEVYKFFIQAYHTNDGEKSPIATVKGRILTKKSMEEDLDEILNSIEIYGGDGGARILWENPKNVEADIQVAYEDGKFSIPADSLIKSYTVKTLDLDQAYAFEIKVGTKTKNFIVTSKAAFGRLVPQGWSIDPSSEETEQEDGRAVNVLDNDPTTYWRSRVSSPTETYPHQLIIDLKEVHDILGISLVRKEDDDDYSSWDMDYAFSKDGVSFSDTLHYYKDQTNPILAIEFNRTNTGEQMYILPDRVEARYIYIGYVRGGRDYALTGDVNVYGQ